MVTILDPHKYIFKRLYPKLYIEVSYTGWSRLTSLGKNAGLINSIRVILIILKTDGIFFFGHIEIGHIHNTISVIY